MGYKSVADNTGLSSFV